MAFDIDILIVYSASDNAQASETGNGWVTDFKRFLEMMLLQVLGEKPNVLMKAEDDSITAANLQDVGILIPVLSEEFMSSGACLDTIEEFHKNISPSDPYRIFKVLKTPLPLDQQPLKLKDKLGYDLYFINPESGEIEEYKDFFGPDAEKNYWMKMVDLAYDIHESYISLNQSDVGDVKSIYSRRNIYLAETGHDLSIQRNIIKRDLQRHGYKILPDHTQPQDLDLLKSQVKNDLANCQLSIHLIGSSYGDIPEGTDLSVVDLQNKLATERSSEIKDKATFSRLIWISPNLQNASDKQLSFIENIKRDLASSEGAEILQTPLEDFKNIVREELIEVGIDKRLSKATGSTNGKSSIYVLHDKSDTDNVKEIKQTIEDAGYRVLTPTFDGELLDLRQHHITNLRDFDAAIIYQGKVNDQWVRMKLLDLLKAPGFGRRKPIKGKLIISSKDNMMDLSAYENHDITVINTNTNSTIDSLESFLKDLN
ncbi:hypothetical protein E1176_18330 [Fulvivirga sp. RKSG066]|uniref:hypothetical protein n=1 Tax=Fulvivirga aurantia TaxID=2529383 RepID=UPI0012BBFD4B|nr:hypothetical protein [Fulvivirga aurantia]MTI22994.1 hypothetical protein [Fulvivirga aurantia]